MVLLLISIIKLTLRCVKMSKKLGLQRILRSPICLPSVVNMAIVFHMGGFVSSERPKAVDDDNSCLILFTELKLGRSNVYN